MRESVSGYGWIEVICGCMFSGKTEELIRRIHRTEIARQKYQIFKPTIDDRYSKECVASHNSNQLPSIPIKNSSEIFEHLEDGTRVVAIDEGQFFDHGVVEVAQRLSRRGLRVIVAGLDMDYRGEPFGPMPELLAVAESVTKLTAICVVCGEPATRTFRVTPQEGKILVGAKDHYEARCLQHHYIPRATAKVQPLTV